MQTYTVQAGDTLYGISKQFGVSVEKLRAENGLTSDSIIIGQVLKIPTSDTTSFYIVKAGDTLYSIANRYNTTVNELMQLNNLKTNALSVGQQIRVPVNGGSSFDYVVYTVKVGDTLYSIAKRYKTTVDSIKSLNNLTSDVLSLGQQLKIPTSNVNDNGDTGSGTTYQSYIVQAGDTLYKIASKYDMTVDELISLNQLKTTILTIGQVLQVKALASSFIPLGSECFGTGYVEPTYLTYTVKQGDSLYTIARKYNTSVENLKLLNDLSDNLLTIGQVLKIREVTS